jgi:hypothetical protein
LVRIEARDPPPHRLHGDVICFCEVPFKDVVEFGKDYICDAHSQVTEWNDACVANKTEFVLNAESISQWHEREAKKAAELARRASESKINTVDEPPRENMFKKMPRVGVPQPQPTTTPLSPAATDPSLLIDEKRASPIPPKKGVNFNIPENKGILRLRPSLCCENWSFTHLSI